MCSDYVVQEGTEAAQLPTANGIAPVPDAAIGLSRRSSSSGEASHRTGDAAGAADDTQPSAAAANPLDVTDPLPEGHTADTMDVIALELLNPRACDAVRKAASACLQVRPLPSCCAASSMEVVLTPSVCGVYAAVPGMDDMRQGRQSKSSSKWTECLQQQGACACDCEACWPMHNVQGCAMLLSQSQVVFPRV